MADAANVAGPLNANMAGVGFSRLANDRAAAPIGAQARALPARGNITANEARDLVEVQRNGLLLQMRGRLSPFGRLYPEALRPATEPPTYDSLRARESPVEAVPVSVGKTRAVTNRIAFIGRTAGTAGVVLEIVAVAVVIE